MGYTCASWNLESTRRCFFSFKDDLSGADSEIKCLLISMNSMAYGWDVSDNVVYIVLCLESYFMCAIEINSLSFVCKGV